MHVISCYYETWRSKTCFSCIVNGMTTNFIRGCGTTFLKALAPKLLVKLGSHPYFAPFIAKIHESFMEEMIVLENVEGT